jgi:hypothetical protein
VSATRWLASDPDLSTKEDLYVFRTQESLVEEDRRRTNLTYLNDFLI